MRNHHLLRLLLSLIVVLVLYAQVTNGEDTDVHIPVKVGVVLDMKTWTAKISNSCMYMAISDFYDTHADYRTRLILYTRDSSSDVTGAAFAAIDLLQKDQVQVVIGPQKSEQTELLVDVGEKVKTPIISFSATNPSIYSRNRYFVRTTPDDHTQVKAIASIAQAFDWKKVILIHEDTDYGNRLVPQLVNAFQDIDIRISHRSVISPFAGDDEISQELQKLVLMQTSIFIVHMSASFGSRFFLKVKELGMMTEGYAWIITNGLMNVLPSLEPSVIDSMQGVLGVDSYIPRTERLKNFTTIWKRKLIESNPDIKNVEMITFGLQAYDSIWALALAAEKLSDVYSDLKQDQHESTAEFLGMQISQTGTMLLEQILCTEFEGLSGKFHIVDGQIEPAAFKIVNVIGSGGKDIGFWTTKHGISKDLNLQDETTYSASSDNFQNIVWPGGSSRIPKGWVIPMNGKKLKIGVPIQDGFNELINIRKDPHTNATIIGGYCIDVFNSVIALLPNAIPYEYIPFHVGGGSASSYNDLIHQVYIQNYDAVVGDVTITTNRSLYVDFALPYTDGGVWMIVPLRQKSLQPLPTYRVLSSMFIFTLISLLIWKLEQGNNNKSRDPSYCEPVRKFVNLTLEKISTESRTNLKKYIWILFVGLTLYYLRTLTPVFTLDQPEPSITNFKDLIKDGDFVGYPQGAFTADLLKHFRFDESRLKPYSSADECHELLSKGSQNGGVSAVFDEMPYVDIFLAKYCSKYAKIGPTHNTDGYGFVFPRGSPIVSDISKALLKVTQRNKFVDNKRTWFGANVTCEGNPRIAFTSTNIFGLFPIVPIIASILIHITSRMLKGKKKLS